MLKITVCLPKEDWRKSCDSSSLYRRFVRHRDKCEAICDFKREMSTKFEMSDLRMLSYYLGIEVNQHLEGITCVRKVMRKRYLKTLV